MRLLILFYIFCFSASPAMAYIEESTAGMAEASAGDQNTNMYKLNSRTDYVVKKLKKIDEFTSKNSEDINSLEISSVDDLSNLEQKDRDKQQNKKILAEVTKATADPRTLKKVIKPDVYSSLVAINEKKDAEIADVLQKKLKGTRP